MAQTIEEQINTIERALGERMIIHALTIIRTWLNELGENPSYEATFLHIQRDYSDLFRIWLTYEDPERESELNQLTSATYRLADSVYASLRLHRGLSPEMRGFNPENPQSVVRYFSSCIFLRDSDFEWLTAVLSDESRSSIALMAVASLARNLRECFQERTFLALIEGIRAANHVVAEQCLANAMLLLVHYDVRIDFFPDLQHAFLEAIEEDNEDAFATLGAIIRSAKMSLRDMLAKQELTMDDLPEELRSLIDSSNQSDISVVSSWMPGSETEYISGLIQILPETWLYEVLVGEDPERQRMIAFAYLSIGKMDLLWEHSDVAEQWLVKKLRGGKGKAIDYINYGHCLLLRGDRMMAFENYREARTMCKSAKEFYALYRPDRNMLVEQGVPVEQIYLLEDQLLKV